MKLSVYYESNYKRDYTWLDVGDEDLSVMIENDYQDRLAKAKDGEVVERRDPQTILNEEISKKTYNNNHKETRHKASYEKLEATGDLLCDGKPTRAKNKNGNKPIRGRSFLIHQKTLEEEVFGTPEDELYAALAALPDDQYRLLMDVIVDGVDQRVIADEAGVTESAISHRKERALVRLRKELKKIQKKSE